jgi:hypothetical protein
MVFEIVLGAVLTAVFALTGGAKVLAIKSVRESAAHLGGPVIMYRLIGAAEVAGAAGLLVSNWWTPLGFAAAAGLVAVSVGGAVAHVRAGDSVSRVLPAVICAAGSLLFAILIFTLEM